MHSVTLLSLFDFFWVIPLRSSHILPTHTLLYLSLKATNAMPASWFHLPPPHTLGCISFGVVTSHTVYPSFSCSFCIKRASYSAWSWEIYPLYILSQLFSLPLRTRSSSQAHFTRQLNPFFYSETECVCIEDTSGERVCIPENCDAWWWCPPYNVTRQQL